MTIAVQNPMFAARAGTINGWIAEFLRLYRPFIYVSNPMYIPRLLYYFYASGLNPLHYKIIFSKRELSRSVDALVCFNGLPYLESNRPVREFTGLKIYQLMDYFYQPTMSNQALKEGGVDYVFGYASHDKYSDFFQATYPDYQGRVLPVPFGFAKKFRETTAFRERKDKVIALGSVRSFVDPLHTKDLQEFERFFLKRGEKFMHKFRRMLAENEEKLSDIMDSRLPHFPQVEDFQYDIVKTFNEYKMFVNCESLLYFPSAKTFEGPAAGSVLVCSEHPCFSDLGFQDGVNCIKHKEFDLEDFRAKVSYYQNHPDKLEEIQRNGSLFVRENYSHEKVAQYVYSIIQDKLKGKK